jgi:carbamoyltransferase
MRTEMDVLFMGSFMLEKTKMPPFEEDFDWRKHFPPD